MSEPSDPIDWGVVADYIEDAAFTETSDGTLIVIDWSNLRFVIQDEEAQVFHNREQMAESLAKELWENVDDMLLELGDD